MKRILLFAPAMLFLAFTGFAQSTAENTKPVAVKTAPQSASQRAKEATDRIAAQAKLSVEQQVKVQDILNDYYTKVIQLDKANTGKTGVDKKARREELQNEMKPKMEAVLSSDQMTVVMAMYNKPNPTK